MAAEVRMGTYEGTGAAINVELGFIPDHVEIINITDGTAAWLWHRSMGNGKAQALGTLATVGSNGVSAYNGNASAAKGFTVGTALSGSGKTFAYKASRQSGY